MLSKDLRAPIEVIFISIYKNIVALSSHGAVEDTTLHSRTEGAQAVVLHLGSSQLDDGARLVVVRNTDLVAISTQRTRRHRKGKGTRTWDQIHWSGDRRSHRPNQTCRGNASGVVTSSGASSGCPCLQKDRA